MTSQGCADAGLCYPPMQSAAAVGLTGFGGTGTARVELPRRRWCRCHHAERGLAGSPATIGHRCGAARRHVLAVVGAFFIAGLLLSLTPCVLPMLPIVSSIIVGQAGSPQTPALAGAGGNAGASDSGGVSRSRGFALAAAYSFGMAVVYTAFGVAAGLAGEGLAAALQNPWVLGLFALGLVALSLSMFGVYSLQLPSALASRVTSAAQKLPAGRVAGVFAMGGVSALIVSPCVAAPLAGALLYLSQTRDIWLGGTALFSLAAGMSVPLLLRRRVGRRDPAARRRLDGRGQGCVRRAAPRRRALDGAAGHPRRPWRWRSGACSRSSPRRCWFIARGRSRRPGDAAAATSAPRLGWRQAIAALLGLVGVLQVVGAASGATDPLQPLARFSAQSDIEASPGMARFQNVRSVAELDAVLQSAGKPVMLDFYADWCVSCKEMERFTFADAAVQKKLAGALLLKADVTANNARRPRAAEAVQPVRPARDDLLRRVGPARSARRA